MDELWCPHFWAQVVWPAVQSAIPFLFNIMQFGMTLSRRIFFR